MSAIKTDFLSSYIWEFLRRSIMKRPYLLSFIGMLLFQFCGLEDEKSNTKITNGRTVTPYYQSSVVKITGCTATFVKHNVLITAAHCTRGKRNISVKLPNKRLYLLERLSRIKTITLVLGEALIKMIFPF